LLFLSQKYSEAVELSQEGKVIREWVERSDGFGSGEGAGDGVSLG